MRIGLLLDDSLDRPDGVQQYVLTLGAWLESQGHMVHYICGETKRTDIQNLHSVAKNIRVKFNGNTLSIPLPVSHSKIRKVVSNLKLDVLHVQIPCSPLFSARVIRAMPVGTRVVATFHILPLHGFQRHATKLLGFFMQTAIKRIDSYIAVSKPAKDFAFQTWGVDCCVIPNAVNIKRMQPHKYKSASKPSIVFLGRLVKRKGARYFLRALETLQKQTNINFDVKICGSGYELKKLKTFVKKQRILNIEFTGFVSEQDKFKYLASADIAVFPSTGGESFGIVLIEAMAAGCSVVLAGNNAGYRSVMYPKFSNQLIEPKDSRGFAEKLSYFLSHEDSRQKIRIAQKEYVKIFDIENVGPKIVSIYQP